MIDENEHVPSTEELCLRISNLMTAANLSDEEKREFARKAVEIIQTDVEKGVAQ